MIKLFLDSDCDIDLEYARKHNAELISMPYSVDDKIVYPYKDWEIFEGREFYDSLRKGTLPSTSALNAEEYIAYFEPYFAKGDDIFYIHFSAAMSVSFDNMKIAVDELSKKYPERKFYEVDAQAITIGAKSLVLDLVAKFEAGEDINKIVEYGNKEALHYACYFFADNLKFFRRSGRVGGIKGIMGDFVGVKPIIYMDANGKMTSLTTVKGRSKAIEQLVNYVKELGDDIKNYPLVIGHTDFEEVALELGKRLKEEFGDDLVIDYALVNPTAGSHCGPNGMGVSFHSIRR